MESLGKDDYKTPRIKLLQLTNPEPRTFQGKAIPGQFWHTGMNVDLGDRFQAVPIIVGKRAILWTPQDSGSDDGILAFSKDCLNWQSGANKVFKVKINKGTKEVVWDTKQNVRKSGLLEWGSSDPDDSNSPPACQLSYEYLFYLIKNPELSPCVFGTFRTAIGNSKQYNTSLLNVQKQGKPIQCSVVNIFAEEKRDGTRTWWVPRFEPAGWAPEAIYKECSAMAEKFADYEIEYDDADMSSGETNGENKDEPKF